MEQRIIYENVDISIYENVDISYLVNDYRDGEYNFAYVSGNYLYVGLLLPFNNLFIEPGTGNSSPAELTVSLWHGGTWVPALDVIDLTMGCAVPGRVKWTTDINKGWDSEQKASDVTGLSGFNIYNLYWARFSWDSDFSVDTTLRYIGQKFSDDRILQSYYPDLTLPALKEAFQIGKTTWDEQHYLASDIIIRDLKKKGIITSKAQIMDYDLFADASCHKCAEIIYRAFGEPYAQMRLQAAQEYQAAMNMKFFNVDLNADGRLSPQERYRNTGFLRR